MKKQDGRNIYANMKNNVLSQLSPQWLCGNSYTWAEDVRLHITGTREPKSAQQVKQGVRSAIQEIMSNARHTEW